jgi:quercetin dioxygenase-like cupin family protein
MEIKIIPKSKLRILDNTLNHKKKLVDLIEYHKGGSECMPLLSKRMGSASLFAFDTGQCLCEHIPANDAMIYIVEGAADVTISGKKVILKQGEMILLPANKPHSFIASVPFKMLLVIIKL